MEWIRIVIWLSCSPAYGRSGKPFPQALTKGYVYSEPRRCRCRTADGATCADDRRGIFSGRVAVRAPDVLDHVTG